MRDNGVQPTTTPKQTGEMKSTEEKREVPATNDAEFDPNQEVPLGLQGWGQQGYPPMHPGWMAGWGGGRGGRWRRHGAPMMFGPGMVHGGPWGALGPAGRGRHGGGGRGRGRGGFGNARRYWDEIVFGDDDDVRSVSGHMEDCHLNEAFEGRDDDGSSASSSSSSSSSSTSSSDSDSGDERASRKGSKKSKRKHGKGRKHKQAHQSHEKAPGEGSHQATTTEQGDQAAGEDAEKKGSRPSSDGYCNRDRRRRHGNHMHLHGHHGWHHFRHMPPFDPMMCPPAQGSMPGPYGPPPPPPCPLPSHAGGPPPDGAHILHDMYLNRCRHRHSKKFRKNAKKFRKANMKAWKMCMKMERQCGRFAAAAASQMDWPDNAEVAEGEAGMMLPPWVFLARLFRHHHRRRHGGRHRFCDEETGRNQHDENDQTRDGAYADTAPVASATCEQIPMDDIEIGEEANPEKNGISKAKE